MGPMLGHSSDSDASLQHPGSFLHLGYFVRMRWARVLHVPSWLCLTVHKWERMYGNGVPF